MADSVYRVTEVIGVSSESRSAARRSGNGCTAGACARARPFQARPKWPRLPTWRTRRRLEETAGGSIRDLRVAEVVRQDLTIENGGVTSFRVRLAISFKYESGD